MKYLQPNGRKCRIRHEKVDSREPIRLDDESAATVSVVDDRSIAVLYGLTVRQDNVLLSSACAVRQVLRLNPVEEQVDLGDFIRGERDESVGVNELLLVATGERWPHVSQADRNRGRHRWVVGGSQASMTDELRCAVRVLANDVLAPQG